jgi:hypothetical protein
LFRTAEYDDVMLNWLSPEKLLHRIGRAFQTVGGDRYDLPEVEPDPQGVSPELFGAEEDLPDGVPPEHFEAEGGF